MNNIVPENNPSNEYEKLDLLDVDGKLKAIINKIYKSTKDILPKETINNISPEKILEERRKAIDEYEKDGEYPLLKIEYEFLIDLKKKLEKNRDDKRQEILETLQNTPEILQLPLKWLILPRTSNILHVIGIDTLGDLHDFATKSGKFIDHGFSTWDQNKKRQILIKKYRNLWDKWIHELEELLKQYKLSEE